MNREAFLSQLEIEAEELEVWLVHEWLASATSCSDETFSDADIARARLILELKGGFGVNDPGVDLILHLLDQLHGFRRAFEGMHQNVQTPG